MYCIGPGLGAEEAAEICLTTVLFLKSNDVSKGKGAQAHKHFSFLKVLRQMCYERLWRKERKNSLYFP